MDHKPEIDKNKNGTKFYERDCQYAYEYGDFSKSNSQQSSR